MRAPAGIDMKNEAIRAALMAIASRNEGVLNPVDIVEAARDPSSVLHDEFEWNDDAAAESYRLAQAGALVRRVKFTIVRAASPGKTVVVKTVRAFQSRESKRGRSGGYESIKDIMTDPEKREELVSQVLRELAAYRRRYADLMELSGVWREIDDAAAEAEAVSGGTARQASRGAASRRADG